MNKSLFLALGVGALGTLPLTATTYDLYITGSTAFRANVYNACSKLYDNSAYSVVYGTSTTGGNSPQGTVAKNTQWTMSGTVSNTIASIGVGNSLSIHAFFTGSVQGMQTVEQQQPIIFLTASGNALTNTPTIAFSDVDSSSTPYAVPGQYSDCAQAEVCVQPFVMCKSVATSASVTNITWGMLRSGIQPGRLPLSIWTHNTNDHGSYVYLVERTKDSGTRRSELAEVQFPYNQTVGVYLFDNVTNSVFYKPASGATVIVGAAGNGGANLNWGSGYVAGSDVSAELAYTSPNNQAIAILSLSDAKSIGTTAAWAQVLPYNGMWPTTNGPAIAGWSGYNDFAPIITGQYPLWAYEECVYPTVAPSSRASGDQNLSLAQLGDTSTTGSVLYTLLAVATSPTATPATGSLDAEIQTSKSTGATAVRICDMMSSRASVGGTITP
jgi:hypothetical protein